jgi:acetyl esterase/lipase
VLVLHGGREDGTLATRPLQPSYLRMVDLYAGLRLRSRACAVYLLRYRLAGWNAGRGVPDPVADARWALRQITERHHAVPIALLGHSMGARTALAVADHPGVVGVCALAPWLPDGEPLAPTGRDRRFVLAHGTADTTTSPALSSTYALRLRAAGGSVARFELAGGGHALLDSPLLWHTFAVRTTLGLAGDAALPPAVAAALNSTGTDGLAVGLRSSLAS